MAEELINGLLPEEEFELLMKQQEDGRGDNPEIDPPDAVVIDNG